MTNKLDMKKIKTYPLKDRPSKVNVKRHFAKEPHPGMQVYELFDSLPKLLGAQSLIAVAHAIVEARKKDKPVVMALGGHVIKCGLQPVLKKLISEGMVTAIAMNGSAVIHDYEISMVGATSEDVGPVLHMGNFGFAEETGHGINLALKKGRDKGLGFGSAIGRSIICEDHPFREYSLLAACVEYAIPATVHVAIGADIIHQHPEFDGAVTGEMSARDFHTLVNCVSELGHGGVWLNIGSAVIMPEVFLKSLSIAQNLGCDVDDFTTANFDMNQHYRTLQNVVKRPTSGLGKGYNVIGHHEINIPLLASAVLDRMN
jgi:hypothetical protein